MLNSTDRQTISAASRFEAALNTVLHGFNDDEGIGTLSERTVHAVLKRCYEPFGGSREVKLGRYVADICGEDGIIEIQTAGFDRMRKKLEVFLAETAVTVVYPVAHRKRLCWIDPDTGERSRYNKSPKVGTPAEIFRELWKIKHLLTHPNLRLRVVMLDLDEYRMQNGWSRDRKRGSVRYDRIPTAFVEEVCIDCVQDYVRLCPDGLGESFTSASFAKCAKVSRKVAQDGLKILHDLEVVERTERDRLGYHYGFRW